MKQFFEAVVGLLGGKKDRSHYIELGACAYQSGDFAGAEKAYAKALDLAEEAKAHDDVAAVSVKLAEIALHLDKLAVAETHFKRAYHTEEDSQRYEETARILVMLGRLYHQMRRMPDAEQVLQYAMSIYQQQFSASHPGIAVASICLADCYLERKSYAEAEKLLSRAILIDERERGDNDVIVASACHKLAICMDAQQKDAEAEKTFERALKSYESVQEGFDKPIAHRACACYHDFARYYLRREKITQARPLLEKAWALAERYPGYLDEADLADSLGQ